MANLLRRNGDLAVVNGVYLAPGISYKVNAYPPGAIANANSNPPGATTTVINTFPQDTTTNHGFQAGDYAMKGLDTTKIALVTAASASTFTIQSTTITAAAGDVFINLGPDTGGQNPTYIQSPVRVPIYSTPDTTTQYPSAIVAADASGNYGYWYGINSPIWELIRTPAGVPVAYFIQNSNVLLTSNSTSSIDNAIVRFDGTTGLVIQGDYSSNTPTISDAGAITAAGASTFGQTGNTTTVAGTAAVAQNLTVGGTTTMSGDVTLLGAGTDLAIGGTLSVTGISTLTGNTTVGGTFSVTGVSVLSGALSTSHYSVITSSGSAPTVTNSGALGSNWGSTSTAALDANSRDNRFTVTITTSGTTFANPATFVVHFAVAFATAPFALVVMDGSGSGTITNNLTWSATTTDLTIQYKAVPVTGNTYKFKVILLG